MEKAYRKQVLDYFTDKNKAGLDVVNDTWGEMCTINALLFKTTCGDKLQIQYPF